MELMHYFETTEGTGILATAGSDGKVDVAIYARPHVFEKETIGFIMRGRLSHSNLQQNPYAAYIFIEKGEGYKGKRLYLKKIKEETDQKIIDQIRRKPKIQCSGSGEEDVYMVYFHIYNVRPLVGDKH